MASEMVERVAEAIFAEMVDQEREHSAGRSLRENKLRLAQAAIKAMREPTTEMVEEGGYVDMTIANGEEIPSCAGIWRAMIDAALAEGEQ